MTCPRVLGQVAFPELCQFFGAATAYQAVGAAGKQQDWHVGRVCESTDSTLSKNQASPCSRPFCCFSSWVEHGGQMRQWDEADVTVS